MFLLHVLFNQLVGIDHLNLCNVPSNNNILCANGSKAQQYSPRQIGIVHDLHNIFIENILDYTLSVHNRYTLI